MIAHQMVSENPLSDALGRVEKARWRAFEPSLQKLLLVAG
jgi:hypothetical protein